MCHGGCNRNNRNLFIYFKKHTPEKGHSLTGRPNRQVLKPSLRCIYACVCTIIGRMVYGVHSGQLLLSTTPRVEQQHQDQVMLFHPARLACRVHSRPFTGYMMAWGNRDGEDDKLCLRLRSHCKPSHSIFMSCSDLLLFLFGYSFYF